MQDKSNLFYKKDFFFPAIFYLPKTCGILFCRSDIDEQLSVSYVELGGVVPNPRLSLVRKGIALCKKEGVDFLLPVGGCSNSDTCRPRFPIYLRTQRQKISAEAREME